jgi:transketolase
MNQSRQHNQMANAIRFLAIDAIEKAGSGHPGLPMGVADIATVLYTRFMSYDPKKPQWPNRDRFILSAGHGSMLLYSLLYLTGYEDITLDHIKNFRRIKSLTAGHPEYGHLAGIETTTGPLGQGLANAVGMAIGEQIMHNRFRTLINHKTYVLAGDGCLMEGISQEAISIAGHLQLKNLIVFWDNNNISIDGEIHLSDSTDQCARFSACGWNTIKVNGHDFKEISQAIEKAHQSVKPTLIACKTIIGFGSPHKSGMNKVHGAPLGPDEISATRKALKWDAPPFVIPDEILDNWRMSAINAAKKRTEWEKQLRKVDMKKRAEFERLMRGDLPESLDQAIDDYKKKLHENPQNVATRQASEMVLEIINDILPETIGGSADLTTSNNTKTRQMSSITAQDFSGRYIHYGIREHAMGAMMNGLALYGGIIPYSGTFLCFSDYVRPAMRLSSLMGIRVIYVMTHDSIGLGEDGPTHQPVEHLASLRALPNHFVFRPADATETAECWQIALKSKKTPSTLALTRQKVLNIRRDYKSDNLCAFGAYEIEKASDEAQVTLFSSGSEVSLAVSARKALEKKGIRTRVVSVPCFELFEQQSDSYKKTLIGRAPVKIAIEAAVRQGWDRFIGSHGVFIGMKGFGASAL